VHIHIEMAPDDEPRAKGDQRRDDRSLVEHHRLVHGHIDDGGRCWQDPDVLVLHGDLLLRCGHQVPQVRGTLTLALHRIHHVVGLGHECVPEFLRPVEVGVQQVQHRGKLRNGHHAWIPVL
jgi:hypothetical protein